MKPHPPRVEELLRLAASYRRLGELEAASIARELLDDAGASVSAVLEIAASLPADLARHLRDRALTLIALTPRPTPVRRKASKVVRRLRRAHRAPRI
jgi:hypothetical protein